MGTEVQVDSDAQVRALLTLVQPHLSELFAQRPRRLDQVFGVVLRSSCESVENEANTVCVVWSEAEMREWSNKITDANLRSEIDRLLEQKSHGCLRVLCVWDEHITRARIALSEFPSA